MRFLCAILCSNNRFGLLHHRMWLLHFHILRLFFRIHIGSCSRSPLGFQHPFPLSGHALSHPVLGFLDTQLERFAHDTVEGEKGGREDVAELELVVELDFVVV